MNNTNKGFHDILEILSRRKWLIIIPLLLGAGIGGWIAYTLPPIFMSSTLIMVEQQKVPEAYVKATDETPIESRLNTISQQIMSRTKLEQIVTDFNLYKEKGNSPYAAILKWVGIAPSSKISNEELIENMRKKIEIKVHGQKGGQKGGDAFTISFTGSDPSVTMQVTNALASLFIEENLKVREQYAEGTLSSLPTSWRRQNRSLKIRRRP